MASAPLFASADTCLVVEASERGRVFARGPDARAFLQRLTTNHVKDLAPGEGRLNAFTNDKGRLVDLVFHLDRGDAGILLVGSVGRGPALVAWLDRYLFSEKVELERDVSGRAVELWGPRAAAMASALVEGANTLPLWGFREARGRIALRVFDRVDANGQAHAAFLVIDNLRTDLVDVVTGQGASLATAEDAEVARIAAGAPGSANEIIEAFNPLDLGLHDAISWTKGCYIGQEVIARLDTYQKQSKRLFALHLDDAARASLHVGAQVMFEGASIGAITSVAPRTVDALPNALAVLRLASPKDAIVDVIAANVSARAKVHVPATEQKPHD